MPFPTSTTPMILLLMVVAIGLHRLLKLRNLSPPPRTMVVVLMILPILALWSTNSGAMTLSCVVILPPDWYTKVFWTTVHTTLSVALRFVMRFSLALGLGNPPRLIMQQCNPTFVTSQLIRFERHLNIRPRICHSLHRLISRSITVPVTRQLMSIAETKMTPWIKYFQIPPPLTVVKQVHISLLAPSHILVLFIRPSGKTRMLP